MSLVLSVALVVLVLFIISSYLFADAVLSPNYSQSERLSLGLLLYISIIIVLGYLYSWAYIFSQNVAAVTFTFLVVLSVILHVKSKRRTIITSLLKRESQSITTRIVMLSVLAFFALSLLYESIVPLVQGWDRAIHFTSFLEILNYSHVSDTYPGSNVNNFYLQGAEFFLSFMTLTCGAICGLQSSLNPYVFVEYAQAYIVMWASIGMIWPMVTYTTAKRITNDYRVATLASVIILFISGREISRIGSIGTSLGYLFIAGLMILIYTRGMVSDWRPGISTLFFVMIATAAALTHIITLVFMVALLMVFGLRRIIIMNNQNWFHRAELLFESILAALLVVIVLYIFANPLFNGMFQEFSRKSLESTTNSVDPITAWLNYIYPQMQGLEFGMDLAVIPILIIGVFAGRTWKHNSDLRIYLS